MFILVDQRAMAIEKGQVGLDWLKVQSAEVIRLADEYEISKYLEYGFEMCGRSMIWLGDMMAEVAGMRTCCLKVKSRTPNRKSYSSKHILEAISNTLEKC